MDKELLLEEDDCAPDAREQFEKSLQEKTGLTVNDFVQLGKKVENGYEYKGYSLLYYPDEPTWHLYS